MNSGIIQDLITSFVTTIPMLYFVASVTNSKNKWLFSILGSFISTLIHYIFIYVIVKSQIVSMFLVFGFMFLITYFFSKEKIGKKILSLALGIIGLYVGEIICYLLWTAIAGTSINNDIVNAPEYQMITYIVCFILTVIYIALYYVFYIFWNKIINKTRVNTIKYFILFPLTQGFLVWFIIDYAIDTRAGTSVYAIILGMSILSLIADAVLFKIVNSLNEKYLIEQKNLLMEQELNKGWDYYNKLILNYKGVNKIRHDIRNQIMIINSLIDKNDIKKAKVQVSDLEKVLRNTEKQICENNIVSSVIDEKEKTCKEDSIKFNYDIVVPENISISGIDLCSLYANILDNAINASKKSNKKEIKITTKIDKGYLIINEENYYKEVNNSKKQKKVLPKHGLGLEIINDIASRYDGEVETEKNDKKYKIVVMLKLNITK